MISGRDIVIISSIEWNFLWQGPQEIASRLARAGNRVFFIENTGIRTPKLCDLGRVASRFFNWASAFATKGLRTVRPNLHVCSPIVLPPFGRRWQRTLNRQIFLPLICRAAASLQMREPLIISFLPTDTAVNLIQLMRGDAGTVVYYCVADFTELSSRPSSMIQSERELLRLSNLVLAQCSDLASHCSHSAQNVQVVPYGVNLESLTLQDVAATPPNKPHGSSTEDRNASGVRRPIIGYVGGLHRHVDLALLTEMAQARPDWLWICIGPEQTPLGKLASLPNVHLRGEFRHGDLAEQIEQFDVGIVPYVRSTFTNTVVPTKINEYLAMGKPVVSTALPAVCDYYHWPGVVVTSEPRAEDFIAAIERALSFPNDETTRARRRNVAALSDWGTRLEHICDLIEGATKANSNHAETIPLTNSAFA